MSKNIYVGSNQLDNDKDSTPRYSDNKDLLPSGIHYAGKTIESTITSTGGGDGGNGSVMVVMQD